MTFHENAQNAYEIYERELRETYIVSFSLLKCAQILYASTQIYAKKRTK